MQPDPQQARFLRKKHAEQGVDEDEQDQQRQFGENLQDALQAYGKKGKKKNIQNQVQYFGHMIQPFNMREEQQMGQIDQDGFFVFKKRNQYRDAWLDSIEEGNDLMVADKVKKRIKTQGTTYKGVYQQQNQKQPLKNQINQIQNQENEQQDQKEDQEQQSKQEVNNQEQNQPQQQQQNNLQPNQIKMLLCQLLPQNKSANAYVKQLKKNINQPQTKQLHDKILQLCNMYIQKTNEYDILTSKREQLQIQIGSQNEEKSQQLNWDNGQDQQMQDKNNKNKQVQKNQSKQKKVTFQIDNKQGKKNQSKKINKITQGKKKDQENYSDDDIF